MRLTNLHVRKPQVVSTWQRPGQRLKFVVANRVAIINPSRVPEQESLFLAQNIPLPTLEQLGNQSPVTIIAFVVLSALFVVGLVVSLVGGGGFFFLRGMLQVLQEQQKVITAQQESDKELGKRIDAVNNEVDRYSNVVTTGLQQLRDEKATKTGQGRSEDSAKAILSALDDVTKDVSGSTERIIEAGSKTHQATTELITAKLDSIDKKLDTFFETRDDAALKAEILKLKETVDAIPKALDECLKQNAQMNLAADVSDLRHDKDVKQHTADVEQHVKDVDGLSLVSGEVNRHIIDGDVPEEHAA